MYCYRAFLLQHDYYAGGKCLPDFLMVLGMLILLFGIRVHPVDEYHPTWGDRTDGRRLRTLPPHGAGLPLHHGHPERLDKLL